MSQQTTDIDPDATGDLGQVVNGPWTPSAPSDLADRVRQRRAAARTVPDPFLPLPAWEALDPLTHTPDTLLPAAAPSRRSRLTAEPLRLPAWLSDATVAKARADYGGRVAARVAVRGSRVGPAAAARGIWRAGRWWWSWVNAEDLADELRDAQTGRLGKEILVVEDRRRSRWIITGGLLFGTGVGETVAAFMVGEWVPALSGAAATVGAALAGRRRGAEPLIGADIYRPITVSLAPEHLNAAFRAAGLLKADTSLLLTAPILRDRAGRGWETVFDLPQGGGRTAAHAIAKRDVLAAELGVDEIQLLMSRVRAHQGGHGRRLSLWVADDDPYIGDPIPSLLIDLERFDFWHAVPFGQDARGNRIDLLMLWQSAFFGGLPRRGKTFTMRLVVAAAILDPWVRIYLADGKGGGDFRPGAGIYHRYISGADEEDVIALEAMLDELIAEMSRRYALFATLPTSMCPESKLTPEIMRRYNLPLILVTIDELQEYFDAIEDEKDRKRIIGKLARIARRGPAAGFIPMYASQRPDAKSVPTKLREIVTRRYCTQVTDKTSNDMVLGDGKAALGADASALYEEHRGVGVLVTGPASHVIVKADLLDTQDFEKVCQRGRALRLQEGTLSGAATSDIGAAAGAVGYVIPPILGDVMEAFGQRSRMWTEDLLPALVNIDEDTYGEWDATILAAELEDAGVNRTMKQVKIDGVNHAGWLLRDIEGAIPIEVLAARPMRVEGPPPTPRPAPAAATPNGSNGRM